MPKRNSKNGHGWETPAKHKCAQVQKTHTERELAKRQGEPRLEAKRPKNNVLNSTIVGEEELRTHPGTTLDVKYHSEGLRTKKY